MQTITTDKQKSLFVHLVFGLIQAFLLVGLDWVHEHRSSQSLYLFTSACVIAWFIPAIAHLSLAKAPSYQALLKWLGIVSATLIMLTCYTVWRINPDNGLENALAFRSANPLTWFIFTLCFIAHVLVVTKWQKTSNQNTHPYQIYFLLVWKHALQLFLGLVFAGIAYALLWLGHGLFTVIHVEFLKDALLSHFWFNASFFCIAFAYAQYLLDRQSKAIESVRDFVLRLFSWMLPLASVLISIFLLLCVLQGFDLLWKTKFAGSLLIGTGLGLIFWINVCYRDGQAFEQNPLILRLSVLWSCLLLLPLAFLSLYAIGLRVSEYGWTADRILSVLGASCLLLYGVGYSAAVIQYQKTKQLRLVQNTNLWMAFVLVGLIILINTPVLDPYKISVTNQINRLKTGEIKPDEFDYSYLRFETYRYGTQALTKLSQENTPIVSDKASQALAADGRWSFDSDTKQKTLSERFKHYPQSTIIPDSFNKQDWNKQFESVYFYVNCYENSCLDIDVFWSQSPQSKTKQIMFSQSDSNDGLLFEEAQQNSWRFLGKINGLCNNDKTKLKQGNTYQSTTQSVPAIAIDGKTYPVEQKDPPISCN